MGGHKVGAPLHKSTHFICFCSEQPTHPTSGGGCPSHPSEVRRRKAHDVEADEGSHQSPQVMRRQKPPCFNHQNDITPPSILVVIIFYINFIQRFVRLITKGKENIRSKLKFCATLTTTSYLLRRNLGKRNSEDVIELKNTNKERNEKYTVDLLNSITLSSGFKINEFVLIILPIFPLKLNCLCHKFLTRVKTF